MTLILPNSIANETPADGDKLQQNFASIQAWANQDAINRDGSTAMVGPLLLAGAPTQPNQAATKAYVDAGVGLLGEVRMYAGATAPNTSWLLCRGQAVSRTTYAALFTLIGTRFGVGNGSSTFNVPNMQGTMPVGVNTGTNPPPNAVGMWITGAVGERAGRSDTPVVSHKHLLNMNSSAVAAHDHSFSAHQDSAINISYASGVNTSAIPTTKSANTATNGGHSHTVNGDSGFTGEAGTGQNYPPGLSFNFIIKAL